MIETGKVTTKIFRSYRLKIIKLTMQISPNYCRKGDMTVTTHWKHDKKKMLEVFCLAFNEKAVSEISDVT